MIFKPAKCPSCGGDLQLPVDRTSVNCMYCGEAIAVGEAIAAASVPNALEQRSLAPKWARRLPTDAPPPRSKRQVLDEIFYWLGRLCSKPQGIVALTVVLGLILLGLAWLGGGLKLPSSTHPTTVTSATPSASESLSPEVMKDRADYQRGHNAGLQYGRLVAGGREAGSLPSPEGLRMMAHGESLLPNGQSESDEWQRGWVAGYKEGFTSARGPGASPRPQATADDADYKRGYKEGLKTGKFEAKQPGGMSTEEGLQSAARGSAIREDRTRESAEWQRGWIDGYKQGFTSIRGPGRREADYENLSWSSALPGVKLYNNDGHHEVTIVSADPSAGLITVRYKADGTVENKNLSALSRLWFVRKDDPALRR